MIIKRKQGEMGVKKYLSGWVSGFLFLILSIGTGWTQTEAPLRNGDNVDLRISGVPSEEISKISALYAIDSEGSLNLPYIGKIRAAGLTAGRLQTAVENQYKSEQIFTNPTIIISLRGSERFVNVGGDVKAPQRIPYTADLTIHKAITAAGDFTDYANRRKVHLLRDGKKVEVDMTKIRKDPSLDIKLLPGDDIFVPQSWW